MSQATKKQDLDFTRERLRYLAQKFPQADAAVKAALDEVERAKLEADLRPNDRGAREGAQHAGRKLDDAILERDTITESIERLRKHESKLASELAALVDTGRVEAQAAFRVALAAAIRAEAPAAQRWAGLILLESELVGRQVADVGHLMTEYLSGGYRHAALTGDKVGERAAWAEAARMRAAYDRGEALP